MKVSLTVLYIMNDEVIFARISFMAVQILRYIQMNV